MEHREFYSLPPTLLELNNLISLFFTLVSFIFSRVQILIFLAALQTISPSIYEAATMDGATAWEKFWKVTFPMLSPYILTNTVYTLIELISSDRSPVLSTIVKTAQNNINYSLSTAMAFLSRQQT